MNTYTLKDLNTIYNAKMYLPKDRFVHYFTNRFKYTEKEALELFKVFAEFPKNVYREDLFVKLDQIIPLAITLVEELHNSWQQNSKLENIRYDRKDYKKLIYLNNETNETKEIILNFFASEDIITYAELLKQNITQIALLNYCTEVNIRESKEYLKIFEGDIFDTNDLFFGVKSNIYVAEEDGSFKKLLYIKGKGYLKNRQELNYDDGSYNSHCLTLREWHKIGNIYTDIKVLHDAETEESKA